MNFLSTFKIAFRALSGHKIRTGLAVLGVMIGMASIIIVFSAGEGINSLVMGQIESFGAETIQTEVKIPSSKTGIASEQQSASSLMMGVQVTTLTLDDLKYMLRLPNIYGGYGAITTQEPVVYNEEIRRTLVFGVSASFIDIDRSEIDYGRFFTEDEDKSLAQVVVLGKKMKEKLFGENDALGKTIKIRNVRFRVIGVLKEQGAVMGMDFDDFLYLPVETMQKRVAGINYLNYILTKVEDVSMAENTAEQIRILLRERHGIASSDLVRESWADTGKDDFRVTTMAEMMDILGTVTNALTLLLLAIVAISLLVGGVGIMNVMYVIVNERTSEIGLRKAVGANYSNIMWQFLSESVFITFLGGAVGTFFGILASYVIYLGASAAGFDWSFVIPLKAFVTAGLFSLVFGVVFGVYPARKAARMDPVKALTHE
ncbi:MAG: ABC transporter permease [Candidatus Marinimicrobia bacterium]|nr:ABC transporter permease [Candidatus Neomarinimicrobiota bacterium]